MDNRMALLQKLDRDRCLSAPEWQRLLQEATPSLRQEAECLARRRTREIFGADIYIRGLIEFTNHCKNDCCYCGLRRSNPQAQRYRLSAETILACCDAGYALGFRTFVLQGGEDGGFSDDALCRVIENIKRRHGDCAVTLSVGERERSVYRSFREAGADRYLLRHETADDGHYRLLHPAPQTLARRKECLWTLKDLGFQIGAGFMVGSPGQTVETMTKDLLFLQELRPHMVGIGPFLPQRETPFAAEPGGSAEQTLFLLSLVRLLLPEVLLPATTALSTAAADGRRRGVLAGANVIMPNLSPKDARDRYRLYDGKASAAGETAGELAELREQMKEIGCRIVTDRGDSPAFVKKV